MRDSSTLLSRSRRAQCNWLFGVAASAGVVLSACGDNDRLQPAAPDAGSDPEPAACTIADSLAAQPQHRFIAGSTYYLPTLAGGDACAGSAWSLVSAPEGNENQIVLGADGYARFTPHVTGTYRFELTGTSEARELTVLPAAELPFHNLNYYPSRSQALVGGELWVANVYTPTVTRIDTSTRAKLGELAVGGWPVALGHVDGMEHVVVAQRAEDTLGFIDIASGHIVDSVWVGDEPANVVVSPDGATAYVALATPGQIAVVDIEARAVTARIDATRDVLGLALSSDGSTLYAAAHRSGQPNRFPYEPLPVEDERDIVVIDTATQEVTHTILDVGATINALHVNADDSRLYVAHVRSNVEGSLTDPASLSFINEIAVIDTATREIIAATDVSRQSGSGGNAVAVHAMAEADGSLWVVAEGSNALIALDPLTLAENLRVSVSGRPRHVLAADTRLYVHGAQDLAVTEVSIDGTVSGTVTTANDPRPADVAMGQKLFTGAGRTFARDFSCNSCHADGLGDTLAWQAGPIFTNRLAPRALFWLEGTRPLGWDGYNADARDFGFNGGPTVGLRPTTAEAESLGAYLASLMPPPAANSLTRRDGGLSDEALAGKEIFENKAECAGCHPMPLGTNKLLLDNGLTAGRTDVPSLVGIYRHNAWLKTGEARTLRDAVVKAAETLNLTDITQSDIDSMTRYIEELTARDFFVLAADFAGSGEAATRAPVDKPIVLTFSYPVWSDAANLAKIQLTDASDTPVAAEITASGRHVRITPAESLAHAQQYRVRVAADFESFDERSLSTDYTASFTTASTPTVRLEGSYVWTVNIPSFGPGGLDPTNTIPSNSPVTATATSSGADIMVDYTLRLPNGTSGPELMYRDHIVIDGMDMVLPAMSVPLGPSLAETRGSVATLVDEDSDGVAERAEGTLIFSGPAIRIEGVTWSLVRAQ